MNEPRILVADDDTDTVDSLTVLLREEGYEVRGVHRGGEVLQAIFQFAPDVSWSRNACSFSGPFMKSIERRERPRSAAGVFLSVAIFTSSAGAFVLRERQTMSRPAGVFHWSPTA